RARRLPLRAGTGSGSRDPRSPERSSVDVAEEDSVSAVREHPKPRTESLDIAAVAEDPAGRARFDLPPWKQEVAEKVRSDERREPIDAGHVWPHDDPVAHILRHSADSVLHDVAASDDSLVSVQALQIA